MKDRCRKEFFLWLLIILFINTSVFECYGMQDGNSMSTIYPIYSFTPYNTGMVILRVLEFKDHKLSIGLSSNGCTDKNAMKVYIEQLYRIDRRVPHYEITFIREIPDRCKALIPEGTILIYDLERELGINTKFPYTITVKNPIFPFLIEEPYFQFFPKKEEKPELYEDDLSLKEHLIKATIRAIETEIKRYETGQYRDKEEKIERLQKEYEKFNKMKPEDYTLSSTYSSESDVDILKYGPIIPPIKKQVEVIIDEPLEIGSILKLSKMTKSGPFYYIAGINKSIAKNMIQGSYKLKIYLVYKREYFGFIPNYYVYVAEAERL